MSKLLDARHMADLAEQAAIAGDLVSADEYLKGAGRIQEAELGPRHPDLANTLNNLAIVAERLGRLSDAETFYRRAAAIASAALPASHPMVADSRENLEAFCRAYGLPVESTTVTTRSVPGTEFVASSAAEDAAGVSSKPDGPGGDALVPPVPLPASVIPAPTPRATARPDSQRSPPPPRGAVRRAARVAIGVLVVVIAALLARRLWSSRDSVPVPVAPPAPRTAQAAPPSSATPALTEQAHPRIEQARPPAVVAGDITLSTALLCETFVISGNDWRCDPPGDVVHSGPLVLYTRVRSPRDATVVHQWYRAGSLRQSRELMIRANATEGYRTYSRQTVDPGDWRVEVRTEENLLYEWRFAVR